MKPESTDTEHKSRNGESQRLTGKSLHERRSQLKDGWKLIGEEQLQKEFKFPDFRAALQFTNLVGEAAEQLNHHPDIYLTWGLVRLTLSTHSSGGLTDDDFKLATKVSELKHTPPGATKTPET